ncbi:MAG: ECF transporter S component [Ruminococcaceae bacterium]|nr:ECF transporter S component [Oscillospiraceae bacterium]
MKNNAKDLVILSLFTAIIALMTFTPLGYIPWIVKITLIQIPVIVGSVLLGPGKGAFLGFVFGLTSLINNTINPGATSFLFVPWYSLKPEVKTSWLSLIICFVPRILTGIVPYYAAKFLKRRSKLTKLAVLWIIGIVLFHLIIRLLKGYLSGTSYIIAFHLALIIFILLVYVLTKSKRGDVTYAVTGAIGAFTNTIFFLLFTWLIFGKGDAFTANGVVGKSFMDFLIGIVTINGCLEIIASMFCVSAILMAIKKR